MKLQNANKKCEFCNEPTTNVITVTCGAYRVFFRCCIKCIEYKQEIIRKSAKRYGSRYSGVTMELSERGRILQ